MYFREKRYFFSSFPSLCRKYILRKQIFFSAEKKIEIWIWCFLAITIFYRNSEINLLVFNFTSSSQKRFIVQNRNSNRIRVKNLVRMSAVWLEFLLEKKWPVWKKQNKVFFLFFVAKMKVQAVCDLVIFFFLGWNCWRWTLWPSICHWISTFGSSGNSFGKTKFLYS